MSNKKVYLSPKTLENHLLTLPFSKEFLENHPLLSLEIGCGNGHFLEQVSLFYPEKNFIGCDVKKDRAYKTLKRLEKSECPNAFVFHGRGEELLSTLPPESLSTFYMNFPDPWPKKRHHKRRFFYPSTILPILIEKLQKGGLIYFASDHKDYFFFVLEERLNKSSLIETDLENGYTHKLDGYFSTLYEEKWTKESRDLYYTIYKKK